MSEVKFNNSPVNLIGVFPRKGFPCPEFKFLGKDLSAISSSAFTGKKLLIYFFPSVDTSVCANSLKKMNDLAMRYSDITFVCISADLPFAQQRFASENSLENIIFLSTFRHDTYKIKCGVTIDEGPLEGLCARSVILKDLNDKVIYSQLCSEITHEPDMDILLDAIRNYSC